MPSITQRRPDEVFASRPPTKELLDAADEARAASLFEALLCEVHAAALSTAIVTSAANALADPKFSLVPAMLEPFVPRDTTVIQVLRSHLIEQGYNIDDLVFVDEFLAALFKGHEALDTYAADCVELGDRRARVLHWHCLAATWREISHLAYLAVRELGVPLHRALPPTYGKNATALAGLLIDTERGHSPCIDSRGQLFSPQMPQQRRSPRRLLCQECIIHYRDTEAPAFARDVSAGGLGLERTPALASGETAVVELANGRLFRGTIAWSKPGSAGLRFVNTLSAVDPLLAS